MEYLTPIIVCAVCLVIFTVFNVAPRIVAAIALGLLLASAIALTAGKADIAGELATYFYCFLVTGLFLIMIQGICGGENRDRGDEKANT